MFRKVFAVHAADHRHFRQEASDLFTLQVEQLTAGRNAAVHLHRAPLYLGEPWGRNELVPASFFLSL